jgi:colanic acid/amylovoran biosynthesis glycosyltransferase
MTVAFFLVDPFPALSETFILNQITGLLDRGFDVRILAARSAQPFAHADVTRHRLLERARWWSPIPRGRLARAAGGLGRLVRGGAPALRALDRARYGHRAARLELLYWASDLGDGYESDIVYAHFGWNGLVAAMLADLGLLRGRLVTAFHGADLSWQVQASGPEHYQLLFERGELFLPVSEHWKAKLVALGADPARVAVHRMGIDCGRFAFRERRHEGGPARLITISRLVEKKGVEFGLRAVAALAGRGLDVRYDVVGDGPLRASLTALAASLGVAERVTFHGWLEHEAVRDLLDRSHLALAPSVTAADGDQEGIPVSLMEAMALGLPVVTTRHSGIPELVEDGLSGVLVEERDVEGLAGALATLVARPELWPRMGRAGRERVAERHDIGRLNDRLADRFTALLGRPPRSAAS